MPIRMNVLGINTVFHESSAALLVDGKVAAACEGGALQTNTPSSRGLTIRTSLSRLLDFAGLRATEIDRVVYSFDPVLRRAEYHAAGWPNSQMEADFPRWCLSEVGGATDRIMRRKFARALKFVPHHLAQSRFGLLSLRLRRGSDPRHRWPGLRRMAACNATAKCAEIASRRPQSCSGTRSRPPRPAR